MKYFLCFIITFFVFENLHAQHSVKLIIRSTDNKQALQGATATIVSLNKSTAADTTGLVLFSNIPEGKYTIKISYVGLEEKELTVDVPQQTGQIPEVLLEEGEEHEEEVIVTTTRISRSIDDIPTRVETISGEELTEKGNMKPGDIRMLLNESTGIQTQQTSATSYNSSIRIQGLDGRYTQILRDGFPLYAGFSGGLSLMQVAPLDLKQIEVIKGSSSTLYGGGAIAGLVNLISKTPTEKRELSFLANGTSAGGLDLSGFYSQKFKKVGLTIFGSRNTAKPYDPADIGLTAIPEFERYTFNPRLFIYGDKTTADIGFSIVNENRTGGNMEYFEPNRTVIGYHEINNTDRWTAQGQITHKINDNSHYNFKSSYSRFDRFIGLTSAYAFQGLQQSTFTEATYNAKREKAHWVTGLNLLTDDFVEDELVTKQVRDYHYTTISGFVQNSWSPSEMFTLETGLRGDYVQQYGFELLPRFSAMYKASSQLTMRLGGGLGYKTPTVFNEESERTQFRNILPINESIANNERSAGGNFDINYRTRFGDVGFALNQLFFYTKLNHPLVLTPSGSNSQFLNSVGYIDTKGMETNLRFTYEDFKMFIGYTYADVNTHIRGSKLWFPLTAKHRLNNVLMYEKEDNIKIGLEGYFFSKQKLNDGAIGKSYWIFGLMGEKIWEHFSIFLNFENFTDTRQTKFDTIFTGSNQDPTFRDIYAPVDGFVVNGGIKIRL